MKKLKFSIIAICLLTAMLLTSCSNTLPQVTKKPPTKTTTTPIVTEPIVEKGFYEYCDYEDAKYYIVSVYLKNPATIETLYKIYDGATDKDKYYKALCYINKTDELTFDSGKDIYVLVSPEKYPDIDFDAGFETEVNTSVTTQEPIISTKPDITTNKSTTTTTKPITTTKPLTTIVTTGITTQPNPLTSSSTVISKDTQKTEEQLFYNALFEHYKTIYNKYKSDNNYKLLCDKSLVFFNHIQETDENGVELTTDFYFPETYGEFIESLIDISTGISQEGLRFVGYFSCDTIDDILVEHTITLLISYQQSYKTSDTGEYKYTEKKTAHVSIGGFITKLSVGSRFYSHVCYDLSYASLVPDRVKEIIITPIEIYEREQYNYSAFNIENESPFKSAPYAHIQIILKSGECIEYNCRYYKTVSF